MPHRPVHDSAAASRRADDGYGMSVPGPESESDLHWRDLIQQVGMDVALSLSSALERVNGLATNGRIDRGSLQLLRDELERARRAGMIGQQIARFASGRIRQQPEAISLTQTLRDAVAQRGREAQARGIEFSQALHAADVVADPTLLYSLLQAVLDWVLECARGTVEFRLDVRAWPRQARLTCRYPLALAEAPQAPEGAVSNQPLAPPLALDGIEWRLVQQLTSTLALTLARQDTRAEVVLTIDFPRTVLPEALEGVSAIELDSLDHGDQPNSKPLAGTHLLVVADRRDVRIDVRDAVRHMGLLVDFVSSVEEAEVFCASGLPHAVIYEAGLAGDRFEAFRRSILAELPQFVFIEVCEDGQGLQVAAQGEHRLARVGREGLLESLPSALYFELSSLG